MEMMVGFQIRIKPFGFSRIRDDFGQTDFLKGVQGSIHGVEGNIGKNRFHFLVNGGRGRMPVGSGKNPVNEASLRGYA